MSAGRNLPEHVETIRGHWLCPYYKYTFILFLLILCVSAHKEPPEAPVFQQIERSEMLSEVCIRPGF